MWHEFTADTIRELGIDPDAEFVWTPVHRDPFHTEPVILKINLLDSYFLHSDREGVYEREPMIVLDRADNGLSFSKATPAEFKAYTRKVFVK